MLRPEGWKPVCSPVRTKGSLLQTERAASAGFIGGRSSGHLRGWRAGVAATGLGLAGAKKGVSLPLASALIPHSGLFLSKQPCPLPGAEHRGSEQELPPASGSWPCLPLASGRVSVRAPSCLGKPIPLALRISLVSPRAPALDSSLPSSAPALATLPPAKPLSRIGSPLLSPLIRLLPHLLLKGLARHVPIMRHHQAAFLTNCSLLLFEDLFFPKLQVLLSWLSSYFLVIRLSVLLAPCPLPAVGCGSPPRPHPGLIPSHGTRGS